MRIGWVNRYLFQFLDQKIAFVLLIWRAWAVYRFAFVRQLIQLAVVIKVKRVAEINETAESYMVLIIVWFLPGEGLMNDFNRVCMSHVMHVHSV